MRISDWSSDVCSSDLYFPAFHMLTTAANPGLAAAQANAPVTVIANPALCSSQFDPIGKNKFDRTACDVAKSHLAKAGVPYASQDAGETGRASGEESVGQYV